MVLVQAYVGNMINLYKCFNNTSLDNHDLYCDLIDKSKLLIIHDSKDLSDVCFDNIAHIIKRNPHRAISYIQHTNRGRWPEAEPYIMKDPYFIYCYARYIIKGRWLEAEHVIIDGLYYTDAYLYADHVVGGRWVEAERVMMNRPGWSFEYARDIVKSRWKEAEVYIKQDPYWWGRYCKFFKIKEDD